MSILSMKDIEQAIIDRIENGKQVYTVRGINIIQLISQEKPKRCISCKNEKKHKDFYRGRRVCKTCYNLQKTRIVTKLDSKSDSKSVSKSNNNQQTVDKSCKPKHHKIKTILNQQKTEYDKLYDQISGIVDTYFGVNKYNVIKKGKKIFGINDSINTKDHLIEEILPLCKCDSKTIKKMKRFVEFARTQVEKKN